MNPNKYQVRLADSTVEFGCEADDSLLRAAQRAGLGFPYECNVGSCGNCKFELLEGEVESAWLEAPGWTDKDRQRRRHLGCQSRPRGDLRIKLRLAEYYKPPHPPRLTRATLIARRAITHDIDEFSFELEQPQSFEPGQYALLQLPGVTGMRAYSMSNLAGDGRRWEFQVRRVPGGLGSAALFDAVQPGVEVQLDGPYGMAWLRPDSPRDILCLAGGSGLAPMISIARGVFSDARLAGRRVHFVYGGRTTADLCGEDMLQALPGWAERGSYHAFASTPLADPDASDAPPTGFVHEMAQRLYGERLAAMEIYFAGPPVMAGAVQRMLLEHGVPTAQQHFDQFY